MAGSSPKKTELNEVTSQWFLQCAALNRMIRVGGGGTV
jgi:hypothetical protein